MCASFFFSFFDEMISFDGMNSNTPTVNFRRKSYLFNIELEWIGVQFIASTYSNKHIWTLDVCSDRFARVKRFFFSSLEK